TAPGAPGWGMRARQVGALFLPQVFGGGGEAPTPAQQEAAHRAQFTADNQPATGVERVSPEYQPPPGTPEQLEQMKQEIANLLADRARAEQEAQHQSERVAQCDANSGPLEQTVSDAAQGISAVQAQQQSVAAHEAANQAQQQRQQEAQGLVSGYPSRATGLAVLSGPLAAWEGFTSLASHLPGDAGDKMLEMNAEARRMQEAFGEMGAQMVGLDSAQPERAASLQGDATRLDATGSQAQTSEADLRSAHAGARGLQQSNEQARGEAERLEAGAQEQERSLADAAAQRQQEAQTLAEQMQAWAQEHRAARQRAIEQTMERLRGEGKQNVRLEGSG
ncbi:hypothetical protein, partial [Ramlibacter alkalitolerans]